MKDLPLPRLETVHLDPMRAEVWIDVAVWPLLPGDEIQGKLVGPQCRYASTIEIGYPVRSRPGGGWHIIIPEPSLWTPDTPFVYRGQIEWRRGVEKVHQVSVYHTLYRLTQTSAGWRLNGKPLELRVAEATKASEQELARLRAEGFNAIHAADDPGLAERAASVGLMAAP